MPPLRSVATRVTPSARKATSVAPPVCPVIVAIRSPVCGSQRTTSSSLEAVASWLPCGLKATLHTTPSSARSEEHTSELQSLMRISYAVFCLKKKKKKTQTHKLTIIISTTTKQARHDIVV